MQFTQMIKLYHSLGPEKFPLNEQTFYPNHTQMVSASYYYCLLIIIIGLNRITRSHIHTKTTLNFMRSVFH